MQPLVSIIVPTFNSEKYIVETIESVRAQTVHDWELIISDDGSTDQTLPLARELAARDERIRIIENPPAKHPGVTRNAGLGAARGRYIAFLDSDDLWHPEKLEVQLEAIQKVPNPGICYTIAEDFIEGKTQSHSGWSSAPPNADHRRQYEEALLGINRPCTSSILIEEHFAREVGPFSESPGLASGQDTDYVLRAIHRRPSIHVPRPLVRYRIHPQSLTTKNRRNWERAFEIFRHAELRGEMPSHLAGRCQSIAWLIKAESHLVNGEPGWRTAFMKSFRLDPLNVRRWPLVASAVLNRSLMRAYYNALKSFQRHSRIG